MACPCSNISYDDQFLEQYGEVSMLDIKGADAAKVILVIGIMTLHSFGEGSGVGVSFAGSKGLSQGILVTSAIAVHNIPEGLAVSMVLASRGVSPQNAMLWSIITSLPQVTNSFAELLYGVLILLPVKAKSPNELVTSAFSFYDVIGCCRIRNFILVSLFS